MVQQRLYVDPLKIVFHARYEPEVPAQNVEYENIANLIGRGILPADLVQTAPFGLPRHLVPKGQR